ncbi:MAG: hypothetical protein PVJ80_03165 [Gemmatimonadota bacterium]|jgi:hypothetical protein
MAIRPRSIGEILDGAIRLYRQDIGLYMFTAIVASLPMALVMIVTLAGGESTTAAAGSLLLLLVAAVATVAVWAALMIQMNERLEGREPNLGPSIGKALGLFFRIVWAAILAYIAFVGVMMLTALAVGLVGIVSGLVLPTIVSSLLMIAVGVACFVFLGIYVVAGMMLFLPGIVVEGLSGYQSLKRGFELAKGSQFRIFAVIFLSWVLIFVPLMAVYFLTGTASMIMNPDALATGVVSTSQVVVQQLLAVIASGFTTPFMVACLLLVYYDQRVRREAFDLQAEADALAL